VRRLRAWLLRLGGLFNKEQRDREMAEELEIHLQMHIEDNLRSGMGPVEARRRALLKLGGIEQVKELCRDRRGLPPLEHLWGDMRFGVRMLRKNAGFTAVAVITLVLGIGANTCMFSVADAAIFRSLPYPDPDQLVSIRWMIPTSVPGARSPLPLLTRDDWSAWRAQKSIFADVALDQSAGEMRLGSSAQGELITVGRISANLLDVLGVRPKLGRGFRSEDGNERVVLISEGLWVRVYGGDPAVVGKPITLDDGSYTITGIISREVQYGLGTNQAWLLLDSHLEDKKYYGSIARLRPGITLDQAQREVRSASAWIGEQRGLHGWIAELQPIRSWINNDSRTALLTLLCAVALVTAAVGIYGVLSYSVSQRMSEFGLRIALGADRSDLSRLLIGTLLVPVLAGLSCGIVGSFWLTQLLRGQLYQIEPHDPWTLICVLLLLLLVAAAASYMPLRRATRTDPMIVLRAE
jgi:putative ABC transport system permease protein